MAARAFAVGDRVRRLATRFDADSADRNGDVLTHVIEGKATAITAMAQCAGSIPLVEGRGSIVYFTTEIRHRCSRRKSI
jgi:hypothetical protein